MNNQVLSIGRFKLVVPSDLMFDIATLKIDLWPALHNLHDESEKLKPIPKVAQSILNHKHIFKPYYGRFKCKLYGGPLCQDTKIGFDKSYFPPVNSRVLNTFAQALWKYTSAGVW